jgi:hypothetical protein
MPRLPVEAAEAEAAAAVPEAAVAAALTQAVAAAPPGKARR